MKTKAVRIERIQLVIGEKKIELSLAEARELLNILADTFGEKEPVMRAIPYPYPYHYPHIWYEPYSKPYIGPWTVTCNSTTETLSLAASESYSS